MEYISDLVPIFVCVVLPVAIVAIINHTKMNADNKRADILMKAIDSGNMIDADKLADALRKPQKSAQEISNTRLLRGCMYTLIGLFIVIVGLVNFCTGADFESDPVTIPMLCGTISLGIGISYLVVYFVSRKQQADN